MTSRRGYQGPDFRLPSERKAATSGLSQRLRARAEERERLLLPFYRVPMREDEKK